MSVENPEKPLSDCFGTVYKSTLKPWHGYVMKKLSEGALYFIPLREKLIPLLGQDDEQVKKEMAEWLEDLDRVTAVLQPYVEQVCAPFLKLKKGVVTD